MRTRIELDGARSVINQLNGAGTKLRRAWKSAAYSIGAESVKRGRDAMSTEVRSGQRVRSYSHRVGDVQDGVALDIGPIRPSVGGRVPIHARVFEGYNAQGQKVSQFVIRPKRSPYLRFPIRRGGGLSKASIVGWVTTKGPVILKPDPTFPTVERFATPKLEEMGGRVFGQVLG